MKIIVSFTSYPPRINSVYKVVESLYRQTVPADEIVLYLSLDEFPAAETELPDTLRNLAGQGGFRIEWVHGNLKSHKKYYYALQEYKNAIVITVDDDKIYAQTMISDLIESYKRFPNAVSARIARIILKKGDKLAPYCQWEGETHLAECIGVPRMDLCAIGAGGICYPPAVADANWFDDKTIMEKAENQDDLWLKYNEIVNNIPVVCARLSQEDITIENSQICSLMMQNLYGTGNDRCICELLLSKEQEASRCQEWIRSLMTREEYITKIKGHYAEICSAVLDKAGDIPIYLYGAGKIAGYILNVLGDMGLIRRITAVIVSKKTGNPLSLYGLQVRALSELEPDKEFGVILGVNEANKREVQNSLAEYHYIDIELNMRNIVRYDQY